MGQFEKAFSEQFFPLLTTDHPGPYRYGPWLSLFAATVAWRTVLLHMERSDAFDFFNAKQKDLLPAALERWRVFILGEAQTPGIHELHFVPFGMMKSFQGPKTPPANFHRYAMRAVEISVRNTSAEAVVFVKMGPAIVLGFIQPPPPERWVGTQIVLGNGHVAGKMVLPLFFLDFLMERADRVRASEQARSPRQQDKINKAIEANLTRAASSETIRAMEADVRMFGLGRVFPSEDTSGDGPMVDGPSRPA
jgi:hypothetical protein